MLEHRHYLSPLFDPSSVLAIVEDDSPPAWVGQVVESAGAGKCRSAIVRLSDAEPGVAPGFDLALVAVANRAVRAAIETAAALGCRAVVVVTDRTPDADSREWRAIARRAGMRMLGPGTMGFVRPSLGLDAGRMGPVPGDGNVALVSQSGMLAGAILDWAADSAIGFSLAVSLGAEVDVDIAQVLDFLASDHRTKSVVLYLEAVVRTRAFMSALRALASVKPVVVLKGQRDDRASRSSLTHSGAICGSDAVYSAALRRAGAVQIRLFTQLFTSARILASQTWPLGKRIAVVSNGSGPAVLASDMAMWDRIALPALAPGTVRQLESRLPGLAIENPLNLGVDAGANEFSTAVEALANDPGCDGLLVILAAHESLDAGAVTEAVIAASRGARKQVYACWMGDRKVRSLWKSLDEAGIPVFRTPEAAVDAYSTVADFQLNQRLLQQTPRSLSNMEPPDLDGARMLIENAAAERRQVLSEMESKALLGAFHVPVTRTVLARSPTEAIILAEQIGFPIVMKISSPDVTHKSDVGGVVLNVRNANEVRAQYAEILASVRRARPEARLDGVTLQSMRTGRFGRELYAGVFRDPMFGPVVAFGAGGTRIEMVRDTTLEFPPLNRFLARRMIERTRIAEALGEFRGSPGVDFETIETLLVRVSEMVCEFPAIAELDINPVIADERGLVAVDARVVIDAAPARQAQRHSHLAILPYPAQLTRVRCSNDGRYYAIRAIRPEDADLLQSFVRGLSEQSRYFRFVSALAELTPRMLVRYTQIDYDRELALIAVVGPGEPGGEAGGEPGGEPGGATQSPGDERIVGVARYLLNPDGETCEFATAIADDWQGQGVGSTLMRSIVDSARGKGLRRIEGYVLANNAKMLGLMSRLGFAIETWRDDPSLKLVTMDLA